MSDEPLPNSEFLLYQTEDGRPRIQCRFEEETLWLTQAQIAELFETTPQNVTLQLKGIFAEGELAEAATCKDYLQVRLEGGRGGHAFDPDISDEGEGYHGAMLPGRRPQGQTRLTSIGNGMRLCGGGRTGTLTRPMMIAGRGGD